jgi:hypothetical protein
MSETQWAHTLHISLNQKKQDSLVFQTRVSGFACNDSNSNFGCFNHKTGCSGFDWLVSNG